MNHLIIAITFTVTLGIVSGAPLLTCDKIIEVNQGKDNQDRYLVILKDPKSYQDAEHVIGLVEMYQWSLEMNVFNVHDTSVKSQLEVAENVGLQGTLSKQALVLVCMDSRVESIIPDYLMIPELTEGSADVTEEDTVDCSKLILTEPYTGEDYSIVLKSRTSTTDLYNIISRVEIEKLNDKSLSFEYHHATRKGKVITLIVTMNVKSLELVCMDSRVESIIPDYPDNSDDGTEEDTVDCSKLILTEPYTGEDYSIVLKPRTSTTDLYNIISRVEIEELNNVSLSFTYHHAITKGKTVKRMTVTMNTKALEFVCKEPKVKAIKPNLDISVAS